VPRKKEQEQQEEEAARLYRDILAYKAAQHPRSSPQDSSSRASVQTAYNTDYEQIPEWAEWDLPEGVRPTYETDNPLVFGGSRKTPEHPYSQHHKGPKPDWV
jgi:hypothetical protein